MTSVRRFKNLGIHVDSSRNAVMSVPQLKLFIDRVSKMGYNQLYLYIEDTYEIEGEPYFGHFRGRYSQEELREIDDYAYNHGIEVIPTIQTLAHLNQIMQWPCYSKLRDIDDSLLVGDEATYQFVEKMIATIKKCFRTDKINLGMDEPFRFCKGKYRDIHGEHNKIEVYFEHIRRVCEIADKYGLQPIAWCVESLLGLLTGNFTANSIRGELPPIPENFGERLPKNLIAVMSEYNDDNDDCVEVLTKKIKWGKEIYGEGNMGFIGGAWKWSSFSPRNELSILNSRYDMEACLNCGIDTYYTSLWGDDGAEASPYSVLPTIVYTACYNQGIDDMDEVKAKFFEWTGVKWDDFMLIDQLDYTPEFKLGYVVNQSKYQFYNDCFMGKMDSMVAPYDAENYARYAKEIESVVEKGGEYKYILDFYAKLASVLALKADMSIRTRKVYKGGDKKELEALISDYQEMIVRTEAFYEAFRVQWHTENKRHGFEVHDIRLGGIIMRFKDCKRILEDFRDGKIDSIPELEEETLPFPYPDKKCPMSGVEVEGWVPKMTVGSWIQMVSTNIVYNRTYF